MKTEDGRPKTEEEISRRFTQIKTQICADKTSASRRIPHTSLLPLMPFFQDFFNFF